jgi:hypothetical protein
MGLEIITSGDLENFRVRLIADIETLLQRVQAKNALNQ